ncbi:MAG: iron-sulfur cluster assembly protein, partial [Vicinamibacteria bacterium]
MTERAVLEKLSSLHDPDLGRDVVALGAVKNLRICAPIVSCDIELANPASSAKERLKQEAEAALREIPGIEEANVRMTWAVSASPEAAQRILPGGQTMPAPQKPAGVK